MTAGNARGDAGGMAGVLTNLGQLFPGYSVTSLGGGPVSVEAPQSRTPAAVRQREVPSVVYIEKVPAGHGIAGKITFLPFHDSATQDSPAIRAAMRLMPRDPWVKSAWLSQILAVASNDWTFHPAKKKDPVAETHAAFMTACVEGLADGPDGLILAMLNPLGADGVSLVEPVNDYPRESGRWAGKIMPLKAPARDTEKVRLKGDKFNNISTVQAIRGEGQPEYPVTDFLFTRYLPIYDEPYGQAAFRASYAAYWMLDCVRKLRALHHEKRAGGMLVGTCEVDDDTAALGAALQAASNKSWMVLPPKTQVEALTLSTAADTDYAAFEKDKQTEIVTGIAMAALQIMEGNVTDARGDSGIQQETSQLGTWYLKKLVEGTVNRQFVPRYIDLNFAAVDEYPRLVLGSVKQAEAKAILETNQVAQAMGFKISASKLGEAASLMLAEDAADELKPPAPPGGMPPFGGGFPQPTPPVTFAEYTLATSSTGGPKAVAPGREPLYGDAAIAATRGQQGEAEGRPREEEKVAPDEGALRAAVQKSRANSYGDIADEVEAKTGAKITPQEAKYLGEHLEDGKPNKRLPDESRPSLTLAEKAAVYDYTDQGYEETNAALRGGAEPAGPLESALRKTREFAKPVEVDRGIELSGRRLESFAGELEDGKASGQPIAFDSYTSTGGAFEGNVQLTIKAVRGLDAQIHGRGSAGGELILPAKSRFKVVSYSRDGDDIEAVLEQLRESQSAAATFSEAPADMQFSLPGAAGERAYRLMSALRAEGARTLAALTEKAVTRLLASPDPLAEYTLFDDDEHAELARSLAAAVAGGDLLGRSYVAGLMAKRGQPTTFAEYDAFAAFAEPVPARPPLEALDYFRRLVPTLNSSPLRYGARMGRHAFTLAYATGEQLLERVKRTLIAVIGGQERSAALLAGLEGERNLRGPELVQKILDDAGVSPRNSDYASMVYRTNTLDAYHQGMQAELETPAVQEQFPAWRYLGIKDGRQGEDHEPNFDLVYPIKMPFAQARGPRIFNCRCSAQPMDADDYKAFLARGGVVQTTPQWKKI